MQGSHAGEIGSSERPLRVAIVGSGPAGFYAAGQLLARESPAVLVDVFDRLPTPWGLVRFGVAPDHPKIKAVTRVFEKTARQPGFQFHGNVEIGTDVSHDELVAAYDAVIYAVGTPADRRLGIPGEDLAGSCSATDFVAWYNGHPDYAELDFDLSGERAVVIGNGNVALDVARMLALSAEELAATDVADHALEVLRGSKVREVVVLGRRGPAQAAFTTPELRELAALELADVIVDPADLDLGPDGEEGVAAADQTTRQNVAVLGGYAAAEPAGKPRRIALRFLVSPVELEGEDRVDAVVVERNALVRDDAGAVRPRSTGRRERLPASIVFRSVGYVGTPLPGVPFDDRSGTVLNADGRVLSEPDGDPLPGVYATGWFKRGPSGVIGTNKKCAAQTTGLLLDDHGAGRLPGATASRDDLLATLRERTDVVDYTGWEAIDAHERALGEAGGRPRVKLVRREEMLHHARTQPTG